jgi:hypothetical protein
MCAFCLSDQDQSVDKDKRDCNDTEVLEIDCTDRLCDITGMQYLLATKNWHATYQLAHAPAGSAKYMHEY